MSMGATLVVAFPPPKLPDRQRATVESGAAVVDSGRCRLVGPAREVPCRCPPEIRPITGMKFH